MPHLQVASASNEGPVDQHKAAEAENDTVRAEADVLLALATTASKQVQGSGKKMKHTSPHPSEEQGHQAKTRDQGTPGYAPLPPVTPSPLLNNRGFEGYPPQTRGYEPPGWAGHAAHSPPAGYTGDGRCGQVLGVYGNGNRRLFASPIRRQNEGEGPPQEKSREGKPEENLSPGSYHPEAGRALQYRPDMTRSHYYGAPPNMMPPMYGYRYPQHMPQRPHGYDERYMHTHSPTRSPLKRTGAEDRFTQGSPKRQQVSKEKPVEVKVVNTKGFPTEEEKAAKQRVISPTSSLEGHSKTDEDDSSKQQDSPARAAEGSSVRYPPQSPYSGPPVMRSPFPPHPFFPGAPGGPIHAGYHGPPREAWRMTPPGAYSHGPSHGPPRGPPHGPPSYPHPYGHPQAGYPYPAPGMYPPHQPPHQPRQPIRNATDSPSSPAPRHHADDTQSSPIASRSPSTLRSPIKDEQPLAPTIKSVAEWQQATLATGMAPSANRCMALKAPIPSKYWGEAEKAKDTPVPDFHRLVNYPDYLTKARPAGMELSSHNGKRNCVMCGKLRVCSASTASLGGSVLRRSKGGKDCEDEVSVTKSVVEETDESTHIIPRQNKGLCTGCDVTVWVVAENKLEIKWCKGCKNFRPWASFGDKGSATKCVRCRDRQREKYAMQKDELRVKRTKVAEEKRDDGDHEMAAAKGLRDLMAMGATSL